MGWHGGFSTGAARGQALAISARLAGNQAGTVPGVCSTNARGTIVNCPHRVPAAQLPASAKNNSQLASPVTDLATMVDTRTWTSGGGNTYPGAQVPFGMIQWSPDTEPHRADGGGYTFGDKELTGYSLTHISGTGCPAAGDIPILPMTGNLPAGDPASVTTSFTNSGEVAQAGFYSARSNMPQTITSRFSATAHAAIATFRFPKTKSAHFLIKLRDSQHGDFASSVKVIGNDEVQGSATSGNFCNEESSKVGPQLYTIYFDIIFSQNFTASDTLTKAGQADPSALFLTFNTNSSPVISAKVGISYVSRANAQLNWQTEIPGWNLTRVETSAQTAWNSLLGEIEVSGGSVSRTQEFYSLLYKDFLQPNIVSDVNGQFLGTDGKPQTLSGVQQSQYAMFSGWDTYHSLSQLQALLDPAAASDIAQSLVNDYAENGILPQWGYLNRDNYAQVGDPSDAIIADVYAFGATNFDAQTALSQMLHQASTINNVRPGTKAEAKYGYFPQDATYGCCELKDYVSALLEYDTADFALAQFAGEARGHQGRPRTSQPGQQLDERL